MKFQDNQEARHAAVKFLYRCEIEKVFYFSLPQFQQFSSYFTISPNVAVLAQTLCQGTLDRLDEIDKLLEKSISPKWSLSRMATMDRLILRLAVYELLVSQAPPRVILNEAIELAKVYGTEQSSRFVNGVLDGIVQQKDK